MSWHQLDSRAYVLSKAVKGARSANTLALGAGDGLAIISPNPGTSEEAYQFVERLGGVSALIVPNAGHNLGVNAWLERFPHARAYAPRAALSELLKQGVRKVYPLDGLTYFDGLEFRELPGTKIGGVLAISGHGKRPVVYSDELIIQLRSLPKGAISKALFFLMRSAPGLNMNHVYLRLMVREPMALAKSYGPILSENPILVPAHGQILHSEADLAEVRRLVSELLPRGVEITRKAS